MRRDDWWWMGLCVLAVIGFGLVCGAPVQAADPECSTPFDPSSGPYFRATETVAFCSSDTVLVDEVVCEVSIGGTHQHTTVGPPGSFYVVDVSGAPMGDLQVRCSAVGLQSTSVEALYVPGDVDMDGVANTADNCWLSPNINQADADDDGFGDACECGDASGNGLLSVTDARLILRCAVGSIPCQPLCDANGDGRCTATDARLVMRYSVRALPKSALRCRQKP